MSDGTISRRSLIRTASLLAGAAATAPVLAACGGGGGGGKNGELTKLSMQGGWLASEGQLGEAVALAKGWYKDEGIDFSYLPGGPSIDGLGLVASKQSQVGQVSSSPSVMLGANQNMPLRAFAAGVQRQPYAYISLPDNPVHEPQDLIGKTVGVVATGQILLDALLKVNDIDPGQVNVEIIGAEITPLTTGQIDVWTGWLTNVGAMRPLGGEFETMTLWDAGVRLYGYPYYAHKDLIKNEADLLQRFVKATSRGWEYAVDNVAEAAEAVVTQIDSSLNADDIQEAAEVYIPFAFNEVTAEQGWGAMEPELWQEQIDTYDAAGGFQGEPPALEDVVDMTILEATEADRPKIGG